MNREFRVREGSIVGRSHILSGRNCQDALALGQFNFQEGEFVIGVICDGCSEGASSEIGARLVSQYILGQATQLVKLGFGKNLLPSLLFAKTLAFLKQIASPFSTSPKERLKFIKDHLLFTVLTLVKTPRDTFVLAYGDGLVVVNDEVDFRFQEDAPFYMGYHLIERHLIDLAATALPSGFDVYSLPTERLKRVAIASDAWEKERELIPGVWGITHPNGLQRKLNVWSGREHKFTDDASIIVLEEATDGI